MRTLVAPNGDESPIAVQPTIQDPVDAEEPIGDEMDFTPPPSPDTSRLNGFIALGKGHKTWAPASTVLTKVRAVKTVFIQYNQATRVFGQPIERFGIVHGPSGHGKTSFMLGLALSFVKLGHVAALIDAEYTTPIEWCREMMGEWADHPAFLAMRPNNYEQTVDAVDQLLERLVSARESKGGDALPEGTSCLIVVDSLKKLIPADIWAKIVKVDAEKKGSGKGDAKGSVDGMNGRMAQIQAAMNGAWMNRLTPLLYKTHTAMMAIAREGENVGAQPNEVKWKVNGGGAIIYDASIVNRIIFAGYTMQDDTPIGERHRVIVRKSKVAGKEGKGAVCYFHTSNGAHIPAGFDTARDVLELAKRYKIVDTKSGGWMTWRSCRWQGDNAAVKKLHFAPEALAMMTADVESRFTGSEVLPTATDEDEIEASF